MLDNSSGRTSPAAWHCRLRLPREPQVGGLHTSSWWREQSGAWSHSGWSSVLSLALAWPTGSFPCLTRPPALVHTLMLLSPLCAPCWPCPLPSPLWLQKLLRMRLSCTHLPHLRPPAPPAPTCAHLCLPAPTCAHLHHRPTCTHLCPFPVPSQKTVPGSHAHSSTCLRKYGSSLVP